jgi:Excreted virulence factor EspC, type VII ESX diderm
VAGQFRVEPGGLASASDRLGQVAGQVGAVDVSGPLARAAGAVSGSSTAGSAEAVSGELTQALSVLNAAVDEMSGSALVSAGNYSGADAALARGFSGIAGGGGGSW